MCTQSVPQQINNQAEHSGSESHSSPQPQLPGTYPSPAEQLGFYIMAAPRHRQLSVGSKSDACMRRSQLRREKGGTHDMHTRQPLGRPHLGYDMGWNARATFQKHQIAGTVRWQISACQSNGIVSSIVCANTDGLAWVFKGELQIIRRDDDVSPSLFSSQHDPPPRSRSPQVH